MTLDMAKLKVGDWVRCIQRDNSDARMLEVGKTYAVAQCFTHGLYVKDERDAQSNYLSATQFEQIHNEEEEEMANKDNIKVGDWIKLLERKPELVGLFYVGERYKVVRVHDDGVSIQQNDEKPAVRFSAFSRVQKVEDFTKGDEEVVTPGEIKIGDLVKLIETSVHIVGFFSVGETYRVIAVHGDGVISIQQPDGGAVTPVQLHQIKKVYPAPVPPVNKEEDVTMGFKVGDFAKVLEIEQTSKFKVGETYIVDDVDEDKELIGLRTRDNLFSRWFDTSKVKKQVIVTMDAEEEEEEEEGEEMVHHPKHYERNDGSMETIQYMETIFGTRALITYCIINSFKYRDRAPFKGKPVEDNEKCAWYLKKAEELASKLGTDAEGFPLDAL